VSIEAQHRTPRRNAFAVFGAESDRAYLDPRAVTMSRARPGLREAMATSQAIDEFASRRRDRSTVTHLSRVEQFVKDDAADTEPGSVLADGCSELLDARARPPRSELTRQ
jgi:hypothetical protein